MTWQPIVVGVDGSPASVQAAIAGAMIARRAGTTCTLVAAVPDYERILLSRNYVMDAAHAARDAVARDRDEIRAALAGNVPEECRDALEVHTGRPAAVLKAAADRLGAGLIVVGSRAHRGLDRLRARIVRYLVRASDIPLLVTHGDSPVISRVLVALDLSFASERTFEMARRWANLFGARLRVLHVTEPPPPLISPTSPLVAERDRTDEELRRTGLWARITERDAEKVVVRGEPAQVIAAQAAAWHADLVVAGSHGAGWTDRLLIGSTAEQLLYHPPALTLVVPSGRPAEDRPLDLGAMPWEERAAAASAEGAA